MGGKGKVTIYDLAKRLGTTASTVSRALQDNPRISQKMRQDVQRLAQELNYIPDPVAHHLRTGRGSVLGIVVPRIDRQFFAGIISAFQLAAQRQHYDVIIAASGESQADEASAVRALLMKKVDGIALSLAVETTEPRYAHDCAAHGVPLIYFDRIPGDTTADTVANDNYQIGYEAVRQLHKRGCRRIGHFAGPMAMKAYRDRYEGYRQALADLGLPMADQWVFPSCITLETGTEAAQRMLQAAPDQRPDAIFSAGDFSAITCMDTFVRKGLNVPRDLALIGVANEACDGYLRVPLASFDLNQQRIGELAAQMLISRITAAPDAEPTPPQHVIVKHDLILRDSAL